MDHSGMDMSGFDMSGMDHSGMDMGGFQTLGTCVLDQVLRCALRAVVVVCRSFQVAEDPRSAVRMLVRELHHVVAVRRHGLAAFWGDHDGAVGAVGLLETRMAVEPVGACLF